MNNNVGDFDFRKKIGSIWRNSIHYCNVGIFIFYVSLKIHFKIFILIYTVGNFYQ